jgi:hypothetical protein
MIKRFGQFISESKDSDYLLYYAFDWDDNILTMPTKIVMQKKVGDEWVEQHVSTSEFAVVRHDKNWKIDYNTAFIEFRDQGERGDNAFLDDVIKAISQNKFAPSWKDFVECLVNGSIFAIITARGHESSPMKKGVEWIIDNILTEPQIYEMYNNLRKFEYLYAVDSDSERILTGVPSKNKIVQKYLDSCDFVGVSSPSRGGSPENPEAAKEEVFLQFSQKVNDYAIRLGKVAKIGFSDDDSKNAKHIEDVLDGLHNEQFSNIVEFVVKGTKDPENITKKVLSREEQLTETSHQTPGLENSVLPFTQFGNMTGRLNPTDSMTRQDDFYSQFKRQVDYLSKNSKEITKDMKKRKKSSK